MERITLNIIPKGITPVCHASQYDAGRVIRLDLMDGLQGYSLTDEEIELNVRKPDGHIVTASVDVVEGQTYVDIVTTEQMCAVEGENICELKISKDDAEIYSLNFKMMVEKSVTEGGDPSESFIHNLRTQIAEGVAEEVATQYDSANVIFDNEPTDNHGIGYTVTSEGIKTAIDNAFDYENTASGSLVHITDGGDNIPMKSLVSQIVAVESGSGEKSPDNPYTISGFDSGIITRCGVNLWNEEWELGTLNVNDGSEIASTANIRNKGYILAKPSTNYYFSRNNVAGNIFEYDENHNFIRLQGSPNVFTTSANCRYIRFYMGSVYGTTYNHDISINYPSTDTQYHAYNGTTYNIPFGQTVYGGHFDNKGNLKVNKIKIHIDSSYTFKIGSISAGDVYIDCNNLIKALNYTNKIICDKLITRPYHNGMPIASISGYCDRNNSYPNQNWLYFKVAEKTTPQIMKDWLDNVGGIDVVYELATPTSLSLTPISPKSLYGNNNIYADTGDIDITYYTYKANDILEFVDSEIGKKNGTNIPIEENSQDSIKDYIDDEISSTKDYIDDEISSTKDYIDSGLSGKADTSTVVKFFDLTASSTISDSGISPFSFYGQPTKTDSNIHNILSVTVIDTQFNNPAIAVLYGQSGSTFTFMVCSARSGNVKIRVAYN